MFCNLHGLFSVMTVVLYSMSQISGRTVFVVGVLCAKRKLTMNQHVSNSFKIITLNCEGFDRNYYYIQDMLSAEKPALLCLQETWLLDGNCNRLNCIHDDYLSIGKSGVDSSNRILQGRPQGGVAILFRKDIHKLVTPLTVEDRRICVVQINGYGNVKVTVICIYMPCDNMLINTCNPEFEQALSHVETLFNEYTCSYDRMLICGDFNTSFDRNTAQTRCLRDFMSLNSLTVSWEHTNATLDYTYCNLSLRHFSCIDHFVLGAVIFESISSSYVKSDPSNVSTHNAVITEFGL